jgi:hypothetical protein
LHDRDQLAGDEGKGDEHRRQGDARNGEDDLEIVVQQPFAEIALQAEQDDVDQAGDHRRHAERQVDERQEQRLAGEIEFRDQPRGDDAEEYIQRDRDEGDRQRQQDGRLRVGIGESAEIVGDAFAERLEEDVGQWQHQKEAGEGDSDADQDTSDPREFLGTPLGARGAGQSRCGGSGHISFGNATPSVRGG